MKQFPGQMSDPFDLSEETPDPNSLELPERVNIRERLDVNIVMEEDVATFAEIQMSQEEPDQWFVEEVHSEIPGLDPEFRTNDWHSGTYKHGYVDRNNELFIQVPKRGANFQEQLERVQVWRENIKTLNNAEEYLEQILDKKGVEIVNHQRISEIDYDFLSRNEELLRKDVEGGISKPCEEYQMIITSNDQHPIPLLIGEYNPEITEEQIGMNEESEEVLKRKKLLGTYIDALASLGEYQSCTGDYLIPEHEQGRFGETKNMFYDPETDIVGVKDLGEQVVENPDQTPDTAVSEEYARKPGKTRKL